MPLLAAALPFGTNNANNHETNQNSICAGRASPGNMEDAVAVVKEELAEKQQALEALQRNFDDFQESSRELEEELEAELGRVSLFVYSVG